MLKSDTFKLKTMANATVLYGLKDIAKMLEVRLSQI